MDPKICNQSWATRIGSISHRLTNAAAEDHNTVDGERQQLQAALCDALLQSILPESSAAAASRDASASAAEDLMSCSDCEDDQQADAATPPATLAGAWLAALPALQAIYAWEDEQVVLAVISFWQQVSGLLQGHWLAEQPAQQAAPAAAASSSISSSQQQLEYLRWLLRLGPATLSAAVQLLQHFSSMTGVVTLQHAPRGQAMLQHLLLLLQLEHTASSGCSNPGPAPTPPQQLLQLLRWPAAPPHTSSATAASAGQALTASEAFSSACKLLQAAAAAAEHSPGDGCSDPAWQRLAVAAGLWLREAYGWSGPDGSSHHHHHHSAPAAAAAAAAAGRTKRPDDTLFDSFMLELLHGLLLGPQASAAVATASPADSKAELAAWQAWANSPTNSSSINALAELVASHDRPELLVRGLAALASQQQRQQQRQQEGAATAVAVTSAGGGARARANQAAAAGADKAAMAQVLLLLERVFLWRLQEQQPAPGSSAATGAAASRAVRQLLAGCAELLRPAANCSVEWRCGALGLMTAAVEQFQEQHPDDGQLHSQLWAGDGALDSLLFCASHDPSIKARRAALALLQLVTLPANSGAAVRLVGTLAAKVSDKDGQVARAALQLLVQLPAAVICTCLTASQWCRLVVAGMELCSSSSNSIGAAPVAAPVAAAAAGGSGRVGDGPFVAAAVESDGGRIMTAAAAAASADDGGSDDYFEPAAAAAASQRQASQPQLQRGRRPSQAKGAASSQQPPPGLSEAAVQQFLGLLREVLLHDPLVLAAGVASASGQSQQQQRDAWAVQQLLRPATARQFLTQYANAVVGLSGCRLLLLLLLNDPQLQPLFESLQKLV